MEKKLRAKLEEELKELRSDQKNESRNFPSGADDLDEMRRKFREAEEKVRKGVVHKWRHAILNPNRNSDY